LDNWFIPTDAKYCDCLYNHIMYVVGKHTDSRDSSSHIKLYKSPSRCMSGIEGKWPVHILKVVPTGKVNRVDEFAYTSSVKVLEEIPVVSAFGKNGGKVVALINEISNFGFGYPDKSAELYVKKLAREFIVRLKDVGVPQNIGVKITSDIEELRTVTSNCYYGGFGKVIDIQSGLDTYIERKKNEYNYAEFCEAACNAAVDRLWMYARSKKSWSIPNVIVDNMNIAFYIAYYVHMSAIISALEGAVEIVNPMDPLLEMWKLGYFIAGSDEHNLIIYCR